MTATIETPLRILLLGGTSEAVRIAEQLAAMPEIAATLALAGRTAKPGDSPLPVRVGGFGVVAGLVEFLKHDGIEFVVDATHPFAAQISANAIAACREAGIPLLAIERPAWTKVAGDHWNEHDTVEAAVAALPAAPHRIFSALGRQSIAALTAAPQHHYVIRVIDPITPPTGLPHATIIAARGPFRADDDVALFREHAIQCVLAKNSGGDAAYAKLEAARQLGLKVYMVRRPAIGERPTVASIEEAIARIASHQVSRSNRGV